MVQYQLVFVDGAPVRDGKGNIMLLDPEGNNVLIQESLISFDSAAPESGPQSNAIEPDSAEMEDDSQFTDWEEDLENIPNSPIPTSPTEEKYWAKILPKPAEFNQCSVRDVAELLIMLVGQNQEKLKDTSTRKVVVWEKIADSLAKYGFPLERKGKRSPGKLCSDKFRAMKAVYYRHKKVQTGEAYKGKLPYYMLMDSVIGEDQLTSPKFTKDSMKPAAKKRPLTPRTLENNAQQPGPLVETNRTESDIEDTPDSDPEAGPSSRSIFSKPAKKRLKPKSRGNEAIFQSLEANRAEARRHADERMEFLRRAQREEAELGGKLVSCLETLIQVVKDKN